MPTADTLDKTNQNPIPLTRWGKDHLSTLLYIEHCHVDKHHIGQLDPEKMRPRGEYPTILRDDEEVHGHSDWDCCEDMVAEDVLRDGGGTGLHPIYLLTERGWTLVAATRRHLGTIRPRSFASFDPSSVISSVLK